MWWQSNFHRLRRQGRPTRGATQNATHRRHTLSVAHCWSYATLSPNPKPRTNAAHKNTAYGLEIHPPSPPGEFSEVPPGLQTARYWGIKVRPKRGQIFIHHHRSGHLFPQNHPGGGGGYLLAPGRHKTIEYLPLKCSISPPL